MEGFYAFEQLRSGFHLLLKLAFLDELFRRQRNVPLEHNLAQGIVLILLDMVSPESLAIFHFCVNKTLMIVFTNGLLNVFHVG